MINKLTKFTILLLSLITILSLISACGSSEEAIEPNDQPATEPSEQISPAPTDDFFNPLSGSTFLLPGAQILFNDDFTISYTNDFGDSSEGEYSLDANYTGMAFFEGYELPIMVKNSLLFVDAAADGQYIPIMRAEGEDWDLDPNDSYSSFDAAWDNDEAAHSIVLTSNNRYIISSHDFSREGSHALNHREYKLTLYSADAETTVNLQADFSFSIPDLPGTFVQVEEPYYTLNFSDYSPFPDEAFTAETLLGAWDNDNTQQSMVFYDDGQVEISSYDNIETATYQYDVKNNEIIISHQNGEYYGYIEEGFMDLIFQDIEGYFYDTDEPWYIPESAY